MLQALLTIISVSLLTSTSSITPTSAKKGGLDCSPFNFSKYPADSWQEYMVGENQVLAVTGGPDKDKYDKVVILLHGSHMNGTCWKYNYEQGWFGDMTGIKYVFPTST